MSGRAPKSRICFELRSVGRVGGWMAACVRVCMHSCVCGMCHCLLLCFGVGRFVFLLLPVSRPSIVVCVRAFISLFLLAECLRARAPSPHHLTFRSSAVSPPFSSPSQAGLALGPGLLVPSCVSSFADAHAVPTRVNAYRALQHGFCGGAARQTMFTARSARYARMSDF